MSDESAFLAAIALHPADITRRVAFADWLDERGQPLRANFWRLDPDARDCVCEACKAARPLGWRGQPYETSPLGSSLLADGPAWLGELGCGTCREKSPGVFEAVATFADFLASCGVTEAGDSMIRVWPYYKAPTLVQFLSHHGGDEDWAALVPPSLAGSWMPWADSGSGFGVCSVSEHWLPDEWEVRIGAHA